MNLNKNSNILFVIKQSKISTIYKISVFVIAIVFALLSIIYPLLLNEIIQKLVLGIVESKNILLLILILIIQGILNGFSIYFFSVYCEKSILDTRIMFWNKLFSISRESSETYSPEILNNYLITNIDELGSFVTENIPSLITNSLVIISYSISIWIINKYLLIILIIFLIIYFLITIPFSKVMQKITMELIVTTNTLSVHFINALRNMDVINTHKISITMQDKVTNLFSKIMKLSLKEAKIYSWLEPINQVLTSILLLSTFGIGALLISTNHLTIASLSVFIIILMQAIPSAKAIMQFRLSWKRTESIAAPIRDILEIEELEENKHTLFDINKIVELTNLNFHYEDIACLENINLEINKGEIIAIVGPSGSGKTTLSKLIGGIYTKYSGQIKKPLDLKISYAPQHSNLFSEKVSDNYLTDGTIFMNEVNKKIEELSGGEKQRVNLDRAFSNEYDLIILDEPTNNLDKSSIDKLIYKIKEEKTKNKSIILVTHNIEITKIADIIVFLDDGKITGIGNYNFLLESHKKFRAYKTLENMDSI
ncbi:ABC transporter ATP-binding protein [Lysinibacillus louembei]|uniref:ABC transporter ATP-binding protein n=1 Tax=Lysinibacillus louembei TaxID=1470088 RepID=A0ABZ0RWR3_9BACI|nr:ABC transporter ATP-binding protein [Lysinibacillus louembei]WPK12672.1 ABC transporter ATP-binding protein [Lysinibacillus louembei]